MKRKFPGVSYLLRQVRVVILGGGEDEDGAEGGHVLQQGEEGAFHSVAHRLPPLRDVWHEHHAGCAAAGLAENLQAARTGFKSGVRVRVEPRVAVKPVGRCVLPERRTPPASSH